MNVQFENNLERVSKINNNEAIVMNNLARNEQIINIAKDSFKFSRFLNDPKISKNKSKEIYLQWTESSFERDDKYFVISEREGNVAGYLLFSIDNDESTIELIAVKPKYQGQHVGNSLIKTHELFVKDNKLNKIKVGTQINNVPAIQFYQKMNFEYISCTSMYHL